jgi:hypothetical protein
MPITSNLEDSQYRSIKASFFHIYHTFIRDGYLSKDLVSCLFKWAIQLHLAEEDIAELTAAQGEEGSADKNRNLEHLFNLVYMIYLDERVDDVELTVLSKYAEKLGFEPHIVNDLLKDIVTAPYDGCDLNGLKSHFREILEGRE